PLHDADHGDSVSVNEFDLWDPSTDVNVQPGRLLRLIGSDQPVFGERESAADRPGLPGDRHVLVTPAALKTLNQPPILLLFARLRQGGTCDQQPNKQRASHHSPPTV